MKRKYSDKSEIPAGLEDYYKLDEKTETYLLSVEGMVHKEAVNEFRDNNIKLKNENDSLSSKLKQYGDLTPDAVKEAIDFRQKYKEAKLVEAGEVDKAVEERMSSLKSKYQQEIEQRDGALKKYQDDLKNANSKLNKVVIQNTIRSAASKLGAREEAMEDILNRADRTWRVDENGEPKAFDGDRVIYGSDPTKPLQAHEWIESLAHNAPHLFQGSSGGGSGGSNKGGNNPTSFIRFEDKKAMAANLEKIASGEIQIK